nr:hypothetical protein [Tanacetum cinerariifolium]
MTGPNSIDWYRQLRIVLSIKDKLNYLEKPIPPAHVEPAGQHVAPEILAAHTAWIKGSKEIAGLMLMTIEPEIQQDLENLHDHEMLLELKICFPSKLSRSFFKLREIFTLASRKNGSQLARKTFNELHAMLKLYEQTLPKNNAPALHAIRAGKNKLAYAPKPKVPPPPKREDPAKDSICHECGETGHWKRNCPQYLAELWKKKKNAASGVGGSGLRASRKLKPRLLACTWAMVNMKLLKQLTSTRTRHALDPMCLYIDVEEHELGDLDKPVNYKAALLDPESNKWLNAMNVEMQSMKDNEVWVLVELPPNDIRAIRILIAITAYYDYEIWQMDIKTAFLNGYLNEEVYMEQPKGEAAYILVIKIYRDRSRRLIGLCQSAYIKRYYMENSKRGSIPMQKKLKLSKSQGASTPAELKRMQNVPYASAVGSIMYASAKQSIFATSFAEAGYIVAFDASKEAVWVRKFISGLGVVSTIEEPISMYCDNTEAITIANESGITKVFIRMRLVEALETGFKFGSMSASKRESRKMSRCSHALYLTSKLHSKSECGNLKPDDWSNGSNVVTFGVGLPIAEQLQVKELREKNSKFYVPLRMGNINTQQNNRILPNAFSTMTLEDLSWNMDTNADNKCSVEFDEFGFSIKDFLTRHIILRCDSSGDLYPVTKSSPPPSALLSVSHATWHQRLGHIGAEVLLSLISNILFHVIKRNLHLFVMLANLKNM